MYYAKLVCLFVKLGRIVKLFHAFKSTAFLLLTILKTKYVQFKFADSIQFKFNLHVFKVLIV